MKANYKLDFNKAVVCKTITKYEKTRQVYYFADKNSAEFLALTHVMQTLKKRDELRTLNTTTITENTINNLKSLQHSKHFTIVKFDFVNYYESLSTRYVLDYYLKDMLNGEDLATMQTFTDQIPVAHAGLCISNAIANIMTSIFHKQLMQQFKELGLIGCYGYVDDFVMIFSTHITKEDVLCGINHTIQQVYYKPCDKPNTARIYTDGPKFSYLNNDNLPFQFVNLGYKYNLYQQNKELKFTIAIPDYKRTIFEKSIREVVLNNYTNVERLRSLLYCYSRRIVAKVKNSNNKGKNVSYSRLASSHIFNTYFHLFDTNTIDFYQNVILDAFTSQNIPLPYYLADKSVNSAYNLYHNLVSHKALVLNKKFGLPYANLIKLTAPLTDKDLTNMSYYSVTQLLLNKIQQF